MFEVPESTTSRVDWPQPVPPPWQVTCRVVMWWHRATSQASQYRPPGKTLPITCAMMVDYDRTPVGPYREVAGIPLLRRGWPAISVPFMAVDNEQSVASGRRNWYLPKVLADFSGDVHGSACASSDHWSVRTTARAFGPDLPIASLAGFAQPLNIEPDGTPSPVAVSAGWLRAKARLARVEVQAHGPTFNEWLVSGTHWGVVLDNCLLHIKAPTIRSR